MYRMNSTGESGDLCGRPEQKGDRGLTCLSNVRAMGRLMRNLLILPNRWVGDLYWCIIFSSPSWTTELKVSSTLFALNDGRRGVGHLDFF